MRDGFDQNAGVVFQIQDRKKHRLEDPKNILKKKLRAPNEMLAIHGWIIIKNKRNHNGQSKARKQQRRTYRKTALESGR
jgi:hypothetical protein